MTNTDIWRTRVEEWRASGLTAAQYCAADGLNPRSLYHWSWRLGRNAEAAEGAGTEERVGLAGTRSGGPRVLRVLRSAAVDHDSTGAAPPIEVELGNATVVVRPGFDAATLAAVLDVVERRSRCAR
jgi:hypothetical protein